MVVCLPGSPRWRSAPLKCRVYSRPANGLCEGQRPTASTLPRLRPHTPLRRRTLGEPQAGGGGEGGGVGGPWVRVGWAAGRRAVGGEGAWVAHAVRILPLDADSAVKKPNHLLHPAVACRPPHLPPTVRHCGASLARSSRQRRPTRLPRARAATARTKGTKGVAISIGHLRVRRSQ